MKQSTKQYLGYGSIALFVMLWLWSMSAEAGGYHTTNNYYISKHYHTDYVTNVTYSGVSSKDLATATALAGASSQHHFTRGTKSWQGSFAGACYDSSADDCGLSLAIGKRYKDVLLSGSVSGASDDRLYGFAIGFTW